MKRPKMIIFDYGHTLACEPEFNTLKGEEALVPYFKSNKNNFSPAEIIDFARSLYRQLGAAHKVGIELNALQIHRLLYEYLEIELSISPVKAEKIFWDATSYGEIMPHADKMVDYINEIGIRSGIISNIVWSQTALTNRIKRLLPRNKMEFIICSSEYIFRKPNPILFELALKKAKLPPQDVWFCGDNIKADIEGAAACGMYSIWFEDKTRHNPWLGNDNVKPPSCKHLHITDWRDFVNILERLEF